MIILSAKTYDEKCIKCGYRFEDKTFGGQDLNHWNGTTMEWDFTCISCGYANRIGIQVVKVADKRKE